METIKRQCNVVMLPTDKEDRTLNQIYKFVSQPENAFDRRIFGELIITASPDKSKYQCQPLYFLSDEEINVEDWCIIDLGDFSRAVRVKSLNSGHPIFTVDIEEGYAQISNLKKVIASTDTSLGLPQPSKSFIEKYITKYNNGNVIEKVMVECYRNPFFGGICGQYIPKVSKDNTITISKVKDSWNRAEVIEFAEKYARMVQEKEIQLNAYKSIHNQNWINKNL